jgi:hypothetical protein
LWRRIDEREEEKQASARRKRQAAAQDGASGIYCSAVSACDRNQPARGKAGRVRCNSGAAGAIADPFPAFAVATNSVRSAPIASAGRRQLRAIIIAGRQHITSLGRKISGAD